MAAFDVLDYKDKQLDFFPKNMPTPMLVDSFAQIDADVEAIQTLMQGVRPTDKIELPNRPFTFKILGNFAGKTMLFGYEAALYGQNPLAVWDGNGKWTALSRDGFSAFPSGAILLFYGHIPKGWTKVDLAGAFIEIGDADFNLKPSQNFAHNHEVMVKSKQTKNFVPAIAKGLRHYFSRNHDSGRRWSGRRDTAPDIVKDFSSNHAHKGVMDADGADEARPPHITLIYAMKD